MTENRYALAGKRVLVTGGGTGIGAAIVRALLDNGARVALTGRRRAPLEAALGDGDGLVVPGDIGDGADVRRVVGEAVAALGGLDVVVSNAGVWATGGVEDLADEDWARMRATNVDGLFHLAKAVLPHLVESGGNLVAVASVSGIGGDWGQAGYNATKHAVVGFVKSLALDWGGRGVRVNAVAPAFTFTEATKDVPHDAESLAPAIDRVALGRIAEPDGIAPAVLFLASADAGYITGSVLAVDGGTSASTGQAHG